MDSPNNAKNNNSRSNNVFGAIFLIGIGIVFLLGNIGWLNPSMLFSFIGGIFSYWPLILIAMGVNLLTNGRYGWWILGVLVVAGYFLSGAIGPGSTTRSQSVSYPQNDLPLDLEVHLGVERFDLQAGTNLGALMEANVLLAENTRLASTHKVNGNRNVVELRTRNNSLFSVPFGSNQSGAWNVSVNPQTPLDLRLDAGVGNVVLDFAGVSLRSLELSSGVGNVTVTLPDQAVYKANIDGGVGQVTVHVNPLSPLVVRVNSGLGSVRVPQGFQKSGDTYYSPGHIPGLASAELHIDGGVGRIQIIETALHVF